MVLGYGGLQNYMMGSYNPYMMSAYAMMGNGSYMNFKNEDDMQSFYGSRIDDSTASVYAGGQGRISQKSFTLAQQLQGALEEGDSSEVGEILEKIKDDKYQIAGIEQAYDKLAGGRTSLRQDIRKGMGGSKLLDHLHLGAVNDLIHNVKTAIAAPFGLKPTTQEEAIAVFNKGTDVSTVTAANALKEATMGAGTDKETISYVIDNAGSRMNEINSSYGQMGSNLNQDIRDGHFILLDGPAAGEHVNSRIAGLLA